MDNYIYNTISEVISKHSGYEVSYSLSLGSKISDFVEDSLDVLELVMELEDAFDISIPNAHNILTVADLVLLIKDQLNG